MTHVHPPFTEETTSTTGTGAYALDGATPGRQTFATGVGDGNTVDYAITDGSAWETGTGTVTAGSPDTLSRDTIRASSNGGSAVNWGSGTKTIYATLVPSRIGGTGPQDIPVLSQIVSDLADLPTIDHGDVSQVVDVDLSAATVHRVRVVGDVLVNIVGLSTSGSARGFIELINGGDFTVDWTASTGAASVRWDDANAPLLSQPIPDINSLSLKANHDFSGMIPGPLTGLAVTPDGTTAFGSDWDNEHLFKFTLSTAWDFSTASKAQTNSTAFNRPTGLSVRNGLGGTVLGVAEASTLLVDLGSALDISAPSIRTYDQSLFLSPMGIDLDAGGRMLHVQDSNDLTVTRMLDSQRFSEVAQTKYDTLRSVQSNARFFDAGGGRLGDGGGRGLVALDHGRRALVVGRRGEIFQYRLGSPFAELEKVDKNAFNNPWDIEFGATKETILIADGFQSRVQEYTAPLADQSDVISLHQQDDTTVLARQTYTGV